MTQWSQNLFEKATFELLFSPLQFHKQSSELKNNLWNRYRCMEIQMRLYNEFGPIVYHMRLYYDLYSNIWIFHRNFVFESMTCLNMLLFPWCIAKVTQINSQSSAFLAYSWSLMFSLKNKYSLEYSNPTINLRLSLIWFYFHNKHKTMAENWHILNDF